MRTILIIHWSDLYVINVEVLEKAEITGIQERLLSSDNRNKGTLRRHYKDTLKKALTACGVDAGARLPRLLIERLGFIPFITPPASLK